jgi:hydrogenase/urease accessory protein HupE
MNDMFGTESNFSEFKSPRPNFAGATPVGLVEPSPRLPRAGRFFRPWASSRNPFGIVLTLVPLLLLTFCAFAHDPGLSSGSLKIGDRSIEVSLGFSMVDTAEIVDLDRDHDAKVSPAELTEARDELTKKLNSAMEIRFDGRLRQPIGGHCDFDENRNLIVLIKFNLSEFTNLTVRSKWLAYMQPGHRQYFTVQNAAGQMLAERMLSANLDTLTLEMDQAAPPLPAAARLSFTSFLALGIKHIWTGYDHLLFLFGLLIVTRNARSSLLIITCFTVAHSITLAAATLNWVHLPSRVVEPLIAASIVYVGVENLIRHGQPKGRWLLTFSFGLIHGLGFAAVLRELGVGEKGGGIVVPLVSFNLGVELGQIAVAAVVLPLIWKLRERPAFQSKGVPVCSGLIVVLGAFWFFQRVFAS